MVAAIVLGGGLVFGGLSAFGERLLVREIDPAALMGGHGMVRPRASSAHEHF